MFLTALPRIAALLPITLGILLASAFFSFWLGLLYAWIRIRRPPLLFALAAVPISFARSTPILIQLFVVYYSLPVLLLPLGVDLSGWDRTLFATLALVLHNGALLSDLLRPAYLEIDRGQHDAADSLGMGPVRKFFRVIVPQLLPVVLPGIGNLLVDLLKDTSILFTIGVVDVMGRAKQIIANHYGIGKIEVYLAVALLYWVVSIGIESAFHAVERGTGSRRRRLPVRLSRRAP